MEGKRMAADHPLTVIFDLGGVLIDWNPRYLYRQLFEDEAAMELFLAEVCTAEWNLGLDAGRSFAEAVAELAARHPAHQVMIEAYHHRWIEMVAGPILPSVAILEELAAREVPLYALTNWSAETFRLVRGTEPYVFLELFRKIFVSGELRLVKPDPAFYRHAVAEIGQPPERCLFIDDVAKNVAGAAAIGLQVHHFQDPAHLRADLVGRGLLEPR
jgi:2-haloacid dehalogenase